MAQQPVTKIYELKTVGYNDIMKQLDGVSKAFEQVKKSKLDLEKQRATAPEDSEQLRQLTAALQDAKIKAAALKVEKQNLTNEAKASQNIRQAEINQQKAITSGNNAQVGSYKALVAEIRELGNALKSIPKTGSLQYGGQNLNYNEAVAKYKQLSLARNAFNAQFTKDGTLPGEYETGIKNGFQNIGNIGEKVTHKLKEGFKEMRQEASGFVLAFVGIQTAFQFVEKGLDKFEETEKSAIRLEQVLKNLGKEGDFHEINTNLDQLKAKFTYLSIFDLREATQRLVTYGKLSTEQIKQSTELAVNLAAQQGKTVSEATEVIIKGYAGQGRGLLDFGIKIKDAKTEQERFNLVTTEVGKRVQGQAEAFQKSGSSSIETYKKQLEQLSVDIGQKVLPLLSAFSVILGVITANFPLLIAVTALYTTGLALQNAQWIIAKGEMIIQRFLLGTLTVLTGSQTVATNALTVATSRLNIVKSRLLLLLRSPYFAVAILTIGALALSMKTFASTVNDAAKSLEKLDIQQRLTNEADIEAQKLIKDQVDKEKILLNIIRDRKNADTTREAALKSLTAQMGVYAEGLKLENILTEKGTKAINEYNKALLSKANAQAKNTIAEREANALTDLTRQQLDVQAASEGGKGIKSSQLSKDVITEFNRRKDEELAKSAGFTGRSGRAVAKVGQFATGLADLLNVSGTTYKNTKGTKDLDLINQILNEKIKAQSTITEVAVKNAETPKGPESDPNQVSIDELNEQISKKDEEINKVKALNIKTGKTNEEYANLKKLQGEKKVLQDQLEKLTGANKPKDAKVHKDYLSIVDAGIKEDLAKEEQRVIQIKKVRNLSFLEEVEYTNNIAQINEKGLKLKIKYLESRKKLDAQEKAELATFKKDVEDLELQRLKKQEELRKGEFTKQHELLKVALDERISQIKNDDKAIQDDLSKSASERAQATLDGDKKILELQIDYDKKVVDLEKKLGQDVVKIAKENALLIGKTKEQIRQDEIAEVKAQLQDIKDNGSRQQAEFALQIAQARIAIAQSNKSDDQKQEANNKLDKSEKQGVLGIDATTLENELPVLKRLLKEKLITQDEYNKAEADMLNKQVQVLALINEKKEKENPSIGDRIHKALRKGFNLSKDSNSDQMLGDILAQSYNLAQEAMTNYFNAEANRIQQSLKLSEQRIDIEKNQAKAKATSNAEAASLDAQAEAKKLKAQEKAGRELKKIKKAEAKISLATELANIASASAANPANPFTFGSAGILQYEILAALAIAKYAMNVSSINSQQFAQGGIVPSAGGVFGGAPHSQGGTPFQFGGSSFEAEAGELAILRSKGISDPGAVLNATGTWAQIASQLNAYGGGKNFAPGGAVNKYAEGGILRSTLEAPQYFPSSLFTTGGPAAQNDLLKANEILRTLQEHAKALQDHASRVDNLKVHVVTSEITSSQIKQARQNSIGTL